MVIGGTQMTYYWISRRNATPDSSTWAPMEVWGLSWPSADKLHINKRRWIMNMWWAFAAWKRIRQYFTCTIFFHPYNRPLTYAELFSPISQRRKQRHREVKLQSQRDKDKICSPFGCVSLFTVFCALSITHSICMPKESNQDQMGSLSSVPIKCQGLMSWLCFIDIFIFNQ